MVKNGRKITCSLMVVSALLVTAAAPAVAASAVEFDVLSNILSSFQTAIFGNVGILKSTALSLFSIILAIDLVLAVLLNLGEVDHMKQLVVKTLKYGLIYWVIANYPWLINTLFKGFTWVGITAGSSAIDLKLLLDPTQFSEIGGRLFSRILAQNVLLAVPIIGQIYMILGFIIFASFLIIAINFLLTYLEFYILAILSMIFIPFGANKYTSWIAQKVGNMMFAFGVKIMVLVFLATVTIPIAENWALPNFMNPGAAINSLMYMTGGAVGLAILAWHAPALAAKLVSGGGGISLGNMVLSLAGMTMMAGRAWSGGGATQGTTTMTTTTAVTNATNVNAGSGGPQILGPSGTPYRGGGDPNPQILGPNGNPYRNGGGGGSRGVTGNEGANPGGVARNPDKQS